MHLRAQFLLDPPREQHATPRTAGVLWFEWIPSLFSPQTVQRAVWNGNEQIPWRSLCFFRTTVSKRTTRGNPEPEKMSCAQKPISPSRKTSPDAAILAPLLTHTLNQSFSVGTPSESVKLR